MLDDEFWEELLAGPPIEGADALCEQVVGLLDGDNDAWIKRIKRTGFLTISELLALMLHKIRETKDPARDEKKVIVDWAKMIRTAVEQERIIGLHPDSHTPISLRNEEGWNWETSLHYADLFLTQSGTGWRCAPIIKTLLQTKKEKVLDDALEIDFLKLIALFATDEGYGYDPSKRTGAVSRMQRDLQTLGFKLGDDRIRTYVTQAVNGDNEGLSMSTIQKLAIGLAIALHGYNPQSPEKSLSSIVKDSLKRSVGLRPERIPKLLEIASQKIPRKPA